MTFRWLASITSVLVGVALVAACDVEPLVKPTASPISNVLPSPPGPSAAPSLTSAVTASRPLDVVNLYYIALVGGDCVSAYALLTDPLKGRVGSPLGLCKAIGAQTVSSFKVSDAGASSGDAASVTVSLVQGGSAKIVKVAAIRTSSGWKISDTSTAG